MLLHENFADITHVAVVDPTSRRPCCRRPAAARGRGHRDQRLVRRSYPPAPLAGWHAGLLGAGRTPTFAQREEGRFVSPGPLGRQLGGRPGRRRSGGDLPLHPRGHAGRRGQHPARLAGQPQLRARRPRRRPSSRRCSPTTTSRVRGISRPCSGCSTSTAAARGQRRRRRRGRAGPQDRAPDGGRRAPPPHRPEARDDRRQGLLLPADRPGRTSIIPDPPWFYSGDLLTVEYRTDPERVAALLPAPLELAPRTPERSPSSGRTGSRAPRAARSCSTRCGRSTRRPSSSSGAASRARPSPAASTSGSTRTSRSPAVCTRATRRSSARCGRPGRTRSRRRAPQIAAGGVFGATLAAGDRRLAEAVVTLREESEHERLRELAPDGAPPHLPRHRARRSRRVRRADLVRCGAFEGGPAWKATSTCGCSSRPPRSSPGSRWTRSSAGYYRQVGVKWDGGASLARQTREGWTPVPFEEDGHEHDRGRGCRGRHPALDRRERVASATTFADVSPIDETGWARSPPAARPRSTRRRCGPRRFPGLGGAARRRALGDPASASPTASRRGSRTCPGSRPVTTARCCAPTAAA